MLLTCALLLSITIEVNECAIRLWREVMNNDNNWHTRQTNGIVTIPNSGSWCIYGTSDNCMHLQNDAAAWHDFVDASNLKDCYVIYDVSVRQLNNNEYCKVQGAYCSNLGTIDCPVFADAVGVNIAQYGQSDNAKKYYQQRANFSSQSLLVNNAFEKNRGISVRLDLDGDENADRCYFDNVELWCTQANTPSPTPEPTNPTNGPTLQPSVSPTKKPTDSPTAQPSEYPTTTSPTDSPTQIPTVDPTLDPTQLPTNNPTVYPSDNPTTQIPTNNPTQYPTGSPSIEPSSNPTFDPSSNPTVQPTLDPSLNPTFDPSSNPTQLPTANPAIEKEGEIVRLDYSDNYILRITIFDAEFIRDSTFKEFASNLVNRTLRGFYESIVGTRRRMLSQYQLDVGQLTQFQENGVDFDVALQSSIDTLSNENDEEIIDQLSDTLTNKKGYHNFDVEIIRGHGTNAQLKSNIGTLLGNPLVVIACIAIILLLCVITILVFCLWRKAKQRKESNTLEKNVCEMQDMQMPTNTTAEVISGEPGTDVSRLSPADGKEVGRIESVSVDDTSTQPSTNFNGTQASNYSSLSDMMGNKMIGPGNNNHINMIGQVYPANINYANNANIQNAITNNIQSDLSSSSSDSMMEDAYDVYVTRTSKGPTTTGNKLTFDEDDSMYHQKESTNVTTNGYDKTEMDHRDEIESTTKGY